jgi:nucleoid-associated protein YgaU
MFAGMAALVTLLAVLAGVPLLMVAIGAVPHSVPSTHDVWIRISSRDDNGRVLFAVFALIVWVCWAAFLIATAREVAAAIASRGARPAREVRGLRFMSRPAANLVAAVAALFVAAPAALTAAAPHAAAHAPPAPHAGDGTPQPAVASAAGTRQPETADRRSALPRVEVLRYDTLWRIAARHLPGDPAQRYVDIKRLNSDLVGPDNRITPGTVLTLPTDAVNLPPNAIVYSETTVSVQPGESLWDIEERLTGDGANWTGAWEVNKHRIEPDGRRFTDPDLILPGWSLTIAVPREAKPLPASTPPTANETAPSKRTQPGSDDPSCPPASSTTPSPAPPPGRIPSAEPVSPPARHAHANDDEATRPAWVHDDNRYVGLTVGGGLLAATAFGALMAHRRRKFQRRRARHVVAPLPGELTELEQTLIAVGRPALTTATFLDLALRSLAAELARHPDAEVPDIVAASINQDRLELHLSQPAGLAPLDRIRADMLDAHARHRRARGCRGGGRAVPVPRQCRLRQRWHRVPARPRTRWRVAARGRSRALHRPGSLHGCRTEPQPLVGSPRCHSGGIRAGTRSGEPVSDRAHRRCPHSNRDACAHRGREP